MRRAAPAISVFLLLATSLALGAEAPPDAAVAARVNGKDITVAAVRQMVIQAAGPRPEPAAQAALAAQALEQLVQRALVVGVLDEQNFTIADADLDAAVNDLEALAAKHHTPLAQILAQRGMSLDGMRRELAWEVRWKKYAAEHVGDAELEAYFNAHPRHFDGSEVRVSHILMRPGSVRDTAVLEALTRQALQLRSEILAGTLTFAQAAERFSAGPSRQQGGDLGFIPRRDRMVESFSKAAFELEPGEISPPVITSFGVHLIQATEIRPGDKKWTDAREQLKPVAAQALFDKLAADARATAKIEYTGVVPHIDPQTHQLVK